MKAQGVDPPRWKDTAFDPHALHARAADLVESVREMPPLAPEALTRIRAGVLARGGARPAWGARLALRLALLLVALGASMATARAAVTLWRRHVAAVTASRAPREVA